MNHRTTAALITVIFISGVANCQAQDFSSIYTRSELEKAKEVYDRNLPYIWQEDLVSRLPRSDRQQALNIYMQFPLIGANRLPFDYYAQPSQRIITIPIISVKFFDEISIAAAWFDRNSCDLAAVSDYVGMIAYKDFTSRPGGYPAPLATLQVPANAIDDPVVDDIAQKSLKSAIYFLMAHELAHVLYQHAPYSSLTAEQAQRQEVESDAYALNVMRRIAVAPLGMALFFTVVSRFEPAPGDFESIAEYETYIRSRSTHPLTTDRLLAIAKAIDDDAGDFASLQHDPVGSQSAIRNAAHEIRRIGETLNDSDIREYQRYRSLKVTEGELGRACS